MTRMLMQDSDRDEVARFIEHHWGSTKVMSSGKVWYPHEQQGFIERINDESRIVGLITFRIDGLEMEILTLNATRQGQGIGTSLLLATIDEARSRGIERVWLTTTNDNMRAVAMYQRLGFRLVQVNVGAVDEARKIKPQIPEQGNDGIPIHDELVLELRIKPYSMAKTDH